MYRWAIDLSFQMVSGSDLYSALSYGPVPMDKKPVSCAPVVFDTYVSDPIVCFPPDVDPCNPLGTLQFATIFTNTLGKTFTINISE